MGILKKAGSAGVFRRLVQLVGPVLLVFIVIKFVDLPLLAETFKGASPSYLFLAYLLTVIMFIGKIFRIYLPLRKSAVRIRFYYFTKIFISTRLLGWISNTFVSDIVNVAILMSTEEKKMRISNLFILNRVADIVPTLVIFGITFSLNSGFIGSYIHLSYDKMIALSAVTILALFLFFILKTKIMIYVKDFFATGRIFFSDIFIWTILIVTCGIFSMIFDAKALHMDLATSFLLLCYTIGIAISVLPISISGIGTREIAFIFLMNLVGIAPEKAIAISFLEFIVMPLIALATLYAASLIGVKYEDCYNR
jgi:uncharacterized membrane protein YbhN (UPF0104 family)